MDVNRKTCVFVRTVLLRLKRVGVNAHLVTLNLGVISMTQDKARPVHEIRLGRIRAAVWENATQNGTRHNVTVSRLYKDGDKWKDSSSFGREDLPLVMKVLDIAHTWIYEHPAARDENNGSDGE